MKGAKMTDPTALMESLYADGMKKVTKIEEELAKAKAEIAGAKAYLQAIGKLPPDEKPAGAKGRRSKESVVAELKEKGIEFDPEAKYADLAKLLK